MAGSEPRYVVVLRLKAGLGIAYKLWLDVAADISAGRLVHLVPPWHGEPAPLHLVVPGRRQLTPAARALRDWRVKQFAPIVVKLPA